LLASELGLITNSKFPIETRTLAVALKAELAGIKQGLVENADDLEKGSEGFLVPDISSAVRIMPEMLSKLGLLNPQTVQKVIASHGVLERYAEHFVRIGGVLVEVPNARRLIELPGEHAGTVARMNRVMVGVIDEALVGLDAYLKS
jgi:hypothetical protein